MKLITCTKHLIEIPKTQSILQNLINVGNNTVTVLKLPFVIGLTLMKVLTVNLTTKNKFPKKL